MVRAGQRKQVPHGPDGEDVGQRRENSAFAPPEGQDNVSWSAPVARHIDFARCRSFARALTETSSVRLLQGRPRAQKGARRRRGGKSVALYRVCDPHRSAELEVPVRHARLCDACNDSKKGVPLA